MCGIAGIFAHGAEENVDPEVVRRMAATLVHRGPDGEGVRCGPGYALGHRRLAIVDRAGGAQPMATADGRVWVTYNGEIYNFETLRAELEDLGHRFATRSDTEVLLHGWRAWGERLPEHLRGMFAFAIVDEERRCLFAARDRLGKKPLYYHDDGRRLAFASELKALLTLPDVPREIDPQAVARFFVLRYVPDPDTVLSGVRKLPPGHGLLAGDGRVTTRRYWRLCWPEPDPRPEAELHEELRHRLDEAVRIRLMGEVPLAPFLSGGIDSYAVVDSMTRTLRRPVTACTIGFEDPAFDEREGARAAARACGAQLREEVVGVGDLLELDGFADVFDEPFGDSSAIPTWHVSRLARRHVTVALSGDGGDEGFAGYRRYRYDVLENRLRRLLPPPLWALLGAVYPKADFLPRALRFKRTLQALALPPDLAYARAVSASLPEEVAGILRGPFREAAGAALDPVRAAYRDAGAGDPLGRACAADIATWLPGDILTKVDRASMAVSLEVRAPFLDHELVEFAARVPSRLKLAGGRTKAFLRAALRPRLEAAALVRRKRGFSVPLRSWFRGGAGTALEAVLGDAALGAIVDAGAVGERLRAHRRGSRDHGELLWHVLVLARYLRRWLP